jgi:catechol 2,3-dioxygenase-like lactoylglutathione lyase family enzyme
VRNIGHIALFVREYDDAINFYVNTLGFQLPQDRFMPEQNKRWVLVSPPGDVGSSTSLLLAQPAQRAPRRRNSSAIKVAELCFYFCTSVTASQREHFVAH